MEHRIRVRLSKPYQTKVGKRRVTLAPGTEVEVTERQLRAFSDAMVVIPPPVEEVQHAAQEGSIEEDDSTKHPGDDQSGSSTEAGTSGGIPEGGKEQKEEPKVTPPWETKAPEKPTSPSKKKK